MAGIINSAKQFSINAESSGEAQVSGDENTLDNEANGANEENAQDRNAEAEDSAEDNLDDGVENISITY
jgi:hypothetical protein